MTFVAPSAPAPAPAASTARRGERLSALVLLGPFLVMLGLFTVYPAGKALVDSFHELSPLNPSQASWVGLDQYRAALADPSFRRSVTNTLLLTAITVPTQTIVALILASALNTRIRARGFFRAVVFLPYVTAPIAVGAVMVYLFGPQGGLTGFLNDVLGTPATAWYTQPGYAFGLVAGVMVWTQIGFFTVIYLAGLQTISPDVYEAAEMDGAGRWSTLWQITLPLVRPTTSLVLVMGIIVSLQVFEQPYVLSTTGGAIAGGPADSTLTMVMYLYNQAFRYHNLGLASASAFLIMTIILAFSLLLGLVQRRTGRT